MTRPTWDAWALTVAFAVATRADCTRRQVGAVILDAEHHRIIGAGYNGLIAGAPGCATAAGCPRGRLTYQQLPPNSPYVGTSSPCLAGHAEENALDHTDWRESIGATMYVTHEPCENCRRVIERRRIARVVWPQGEWTL